MTEIVVNKCYGGFSLSHKGIMLYSQKKGMNITPYSGGFGDDVYTRVEEGEENDISYVSIYYTTKDFGDTCTKDQLNDNYFSTYEVDRDDPILVEVVKELGEDANGSYANLCITEIPDGVKWQIEEYGGQEWIAEQHRTW